MIPPQKPPLDERRTGSETVPRAHERAGRDCWLSSRPSKRGHGEEIGASPPSRRAAARAPGAAHLARSQCFALRARRAGGSPGGVTSPSPAASPRRGAARLLLTRRRRRRKGEREEGRFSQPGGGASPRPAAARTPAALRLPQWRRQRTIRLILKPSRPCKTNFLPLDSRPLAPESPGARAVVDASAAPASSELFVGSVLPVYGAV